MQEEIAKLEFGRVAHAEWDGAADPDLKPNKVTPYISQGDYKRVWHKPLFGLLNSNSKWIPTNYAPLTFEFTLQDGAEWCDTNQRAVAAAGGVAAHNADASTTYQLRNMYLYYDICQLDSELTSQFSNMLKSGGAMNLVYELSLIHI